MTNLWSSLEHSVRFAAILISIKINIFVRLNDFCYKPILNNVKFTFVEKNSEKQFFKTFFKNILLSHTHIYIYIYIYILLHGVENRRDIFFFVHYKVCFIRPYYSETKNEIGKRGAKWTFSNHAWFARWLTRLKEEEKKKRKKWNCKSTPFHFLPISASLELLEWTLGNLINHVFGSKSQGRTLLVFDWQSDYSSSGFDFKASTFIPGLCFTTPEMWLRKRTAEN